MTRYAQAIPAVRPHNFSPVAQPFVLGRQFAEIEIVKVVEHESPLFERGAVP